MPSPPSAQICHLTARRLRIRVPERRRDTAFFETVAARLSTWQGVERVETNPLTASILVYCADPQRLVAESAAANDLFEIDFKPDSDTVVSRAARSFDAADGTLRRWSDGQIDIRSLLFVVFFVSGIYQLLRGRIAAPAPSLLWRAGDLLGLWDRIYRNGRDHGSAGATTQASSGSPPGRFG
jgi:Heavy metal associated domain 2